jgi:hypothetical protein
LPRWARVGQDRTTGPAKEGSGPPARHMDLRPLAVEFRLGHVAGIAQAARIPEGGESIGAMNMAGRSVYQAAG